MPIPKSIDHTKAHYILSKYLFAFILFLPVFDLLSFLYLKGFISVPLATVAKPFLMGLLNLGLILVYRKHFWRCAIPYGLYLILIVCHVYFTNALQIDRSYILTNIRTSISLLYFLICIFNLKILYEEAPDRSRFIRHLGITLLAAFALYFFLYFLAVLTGTSALTYEYADAKKLGWKGWLDSGQVLAHGICICLPFLCYCLLHNKHKKPWLQFLCKFAIIIPVLVLCMIGTKVGYYIPILVLVAQTILELFFAIRDKSREYVWNAIICAVLAAACILAYPITPVKTNNYWNEHALADPVDSPRLVEVINQNEENQISFGDKDSAWTKHALSVLRQKYESGELHPADSRDQQLTFNLEKFKQADLPYKLFGIGHWNQCAMAMERDIMAVLFGYGIFVFILILAEPVLLWLKSAFGILKNLKQVNLVTLCLFEGLSMAFCISWFAGSTFIYPQFTIFLAIIMCLLNHHLRCLRSQNDRV